MAAPPWSWESAVAGAIAGFATVASLHPLDVVRTRFQVNDGRARNFPAYKHTGHALYFIAKNEQTGIFGLRGLYAGFYPALFGSTLSWGLYFFFYSNAKSRYIQGKEEQLSPGYHLASAAEAGALVSLCTNPIWLVKTRLQLQTPHYPDRPYSGFSHALKTIWKEEGWHALFRGLGPSLLLVTHGAIQFTVYEELRKFAIYVKDKEQKNADHSEKLLNSSQYAAIGAASKLAATLFTYPYQVIRARLQQRPSIDGAPKYSDSWHVMKETARFEGVRGFYRGMTSNLLKNLPASSITFVVYENVLHLLKTTR